MASGDEYKLLLEGDAKISSDGVCTGASVRDRKKTVAICGGTATERKALRVQLKSKKARARVGEHAVHYAVLTTGCDIDATAIALAKNGALKPVGPLIRRSVMNTIVRDICGFVASVFQWKDMKSADDRKLVDDVLNDLPRVTRSERVAAILPGLKFRRFDSQQGGFTSRMMAFELRGSGRA